MLPVGKTNRLTARPRSDASVRFCLNRSPANEGVLMLSRKRRNLGSQTERRACPRLLSRGQTFEKPKIVIFLLVTIVSMIVPLTVVSLASAQQPAPQATGAVDSDGFPLKAPPGWNQKHWDETLQYCRNIAKKGRANQPLDKGEIAGSGMCASLSVQFFGPQGPPPGSYISPDRPTLLRLPELVPPGSKRGRRYPALRVSPIRRPGCQISWRHFQG